MTLHELVDRSSCQQATGVENFADETMPLVGADVLISFCDLLGDLLLLYRCWVIWGKNYWIVFTPLVTAGAGFGMPPPIVSRKHDLIHVGPHQHASWASRTSS